MRLPPVIRATLSVRSTAGRYGRDGAGRAGRKSRTGGWQGGRHVPTCPTRLTRPTCLQSSVREGAEERGALFGSLHLVPSAEPVNACSAARPMSPATTDASGWNHCIAPQLGSCVMCLLTSSAICGGRDLNLTAVIGELNRRRASPARWCRRGRSRARWPSRRARAAGRRLAR